MITFCQFGAGRIGAIHAGRMHANADRAIYERWRGNLYDAQIRLDGAHFRRVVYLHKLLCPPKRSFAAD